METSISLDFAAVVAALVPVLTIIVVAMVGKKAIDEGNEKLDGIHILVNSAMTQVLREQLQDRQAFKAVLEGVFEEERTEAQELLLENLEERIQSLQEEIAKRDIQAAYIPGFPKKEGT